MTVFTPETLVQVYTAIHSGRHSWETQPLGSVTLWGRPITLTEAQQLELAAGGQVRYGSDWDDLMRLPRAPEGVPTPAPAHRFTCPRCGDHRDTTVTGQCDDCNA